MKDDYYQKELFETDVLERIMLLFHITSQSFNEIKGLMNNRSEAAIEKISRELSAGIEMLQQPELEISGI